MSREPIPVLVVDDNEAFLDVARPTLEETEPRFVVHTVLNGADAIAFFERRPPFASAPRPAFIVLDFWLPDMNGTEVLRELAARGANRGVPALVLSQADWDEDQAGAREAGATAFRVKPSRVDALREMIVTFWKEHVDGNQHSLGRGFG